MKAKITIVAGGFSASRFNLGKLPGLVIAVNDSAIYAPHVDLVVSMDRLWTEHRYEQVRRIGVPLWLRRSTLANLKTDFMVRPFECDNKSTTLAERPGVLNGPHSGFCALNLAYQMRPAELYLVGFDMALGPRGERHWHAAYPWKSGGGSSAGTLAEWSGQFDTAAQQLRAAGVSVYQAGATAIRTFQPIERAELEQRAVCAA